MATFDVPSGTLLSLLAGGGAASKWGAGRWRLLEAASPPLLLVTFNEVEHALRLDDASQGPPGFAMVSKRRLAGERSLVEDVGSSAYSRAIEPQSVPCCATRGWPQDITPSK